MAISDPIADMLTRTRNAVLARHDSVLMPASKMKLSIAQILKEEGFITDYEVIGAKAQAKLKLKLRYGERNRPFINGLKRVSKPGLRVYVARGEIPRVYGGMGIAIVSTSGGVLPSYKAWQRNLGGELVCYVW
ncbi:MAG: 30S ribosomal protein S8 [Dehalococcoidia bacterium]|nr:30S ribosomal protein S8 [Dehalococcoidia bacterium]